ncbi:MAG TPA: cyclic nucleotide-binding domain-containing protein [Gaiellaceae bacterium]|nr:cyclic nucleotide-binding domain-containing protein [Gaiellaceae bacterium]
MDRQRLAAIPLFSTLPEPELTAAAARAGELEVEEGHMLVTEGEFGHCLYAIESGTADVTRDGETIRTLGPGDVVGEVAVLAAGRRSASIVATSPMTLVTFFKRDVWALEDDAPEAAHRLRELIGTRSIPTAR